MKIINVRKFLGVSVLALGLTVVTVLPASAQSNTNGANTTSRTVERDNGTDWSWLGWLGLLGLAGLMPKKRHVEVQQHRDTGTNRT
jgi:hypothetical protein